MGDGEPQEEEKIVVSAAMMRADRFRPVSLITLLPPSEFILFFLMQMEKEIQKELRFRGTRPMHGRFPFHLSTNSCQERRMHKFTNRFRFRPRAGSSENAASGSDSPPSVPPVLTQSASASSVVHQILKISKI